MTEQPPSAEAGYPPELLEEIRSEANRRMITLTEWLRRAAVSALPYEAMSSRDALLDALRNADGVLADIRRDALDAALPREERVHQGAAYGAYVHTLRTALQAAAAALPVRESSDAYEQAVEDEPEHSRELAQAWGRACGIGTAADLLAALSGMLPFDDPMVDH